MNHNMWWMIAFLLSQVPIFVTGRVTFTELYSPKVVTMDCQSDTDIAFHFTNKSSNREVRVAECETLLHAKSCFLVDTSLKEFYAVTVTQKGGLFYILKDDSRTHGLYKCCELYNNSVCDSKEIGSMAKSIESPAKSTTQVNSVPTVHEDNHRSKETPSNNGIIIAAFVAIGIGLCVAIVCRKPPDFQRMCQRKKEDEHTDDNSSPKTAAVQAQYEDDDSPETPMISMEKNTNAEPASSNTEGKKTDDEHTKSAFEADMPTHSLKEQDVNGMSTCIVDLKSAATTVAIGLRKKDGITLTLTQKLEQEWPTIYRKDKPYQEQNYVGNETSPLLSDLNKPTSEPSFIRLRFEIERFNRLKYSCEKIKGILTICDQDFPFLNVSPLLDGELNNVVHVYTPKQFQHNFQDGSTETTQKMTFHELVEILKKSNSFALIVIDSAMQLAAVDGMNRSKLRNAGVLYVGITEELPIPSGVFYSKTQPKKIIEDADALLVRCAFATLKTFYLTLQRYELDNTLPEHEEYKLDDVFVLIKSAFDNSGIPSAEIPNIHIAANFEYPVSMKTALRKIECIPGVNGCYKKLRGLQIYIDPSAANSDTQQRITNELNKYEFTKYSFVYGKAKPLCSSGNTVYGYGTIDGSVNTVVLQNVSVRDENTVTKHYYSDSLAGMNKCSTRVLISCNAVQNEKTQLLAVTELIRSFGFKLLSDIGMSVLPVDVCETFTQLCGTLFRIGLKASMHQLIKYADISALKENSVHQWNDIQCACFLMPAEHDVSCLIMDVHDRRRVMPLTQRGDSDETVEDANKTATEPVFIRLEYGLERFKRLKYSCDTIEGILTICDQDFPFLNASLLLDDDLNKVVHVYTTEQFQHHFQDGSKTTTLNMTIHGVIERLKHRHAFALIVVDSTMQFAAMDGIKESTLCYSGVLFVGMTEESPVPFDVSFSRTEPDKIIEAADALLVRCAFTTLKTLSLSLQGYVSQDTFSEHEMSKLDDVFYLLKAAFDNSGIPSAEKPTIDILPKVEYSATVKKAIEHIQCMPGVIVCLTKPRWLQIYIDSSAASSDIDKTIMNELKKCQVTKYAFVYGKPKPLSQCSSGDSVFGCCGTIGGFVKKVTLPKVSVRDGISNSTLDYSDISANVIERRTAALVSQHVVAHAHSPLLIVDRFPQPLGRIHFHNHISDIDILPVDVYEELNYLCDPRFRTELNVSMYAKLTKSEDIMHMRGNPVHIWSSRSCPGLGMIIESDANGMRILVRDRQRHTPFAQAGDSGAMICYFDPHREELYVVAMLINAMQLDGEYGYRRYTAQILDNALQRLSIKNDCQYAIFEDEV